MLKDASRVTHDHIAVSNSVHLVNLFRIYKLIKFAEQLRQKFQDFFGVFDSLTKSSEANHIRVQQSHVVDFLNYAFVIF